jgi:hypothetical protein
MRSPRLRGKLIYLRDSLGTFFFVKPDLYSHRTELATGLGSCWPRAGTRPHAGTGPRHAGAGLIQFKGIQMNTYYFGKRTSVYIHVYSVYA